MGFTKKLFKKSFLGVYATRVLKGCLFLLTILVAISDRMMTSLHLVTYILLAFTAMTTIDIYCQIVGDRIKTRVPCTQSEFLHVTGEFLPQMLPGVAGAFIFALAAMGMMSQNLAFNVTEVGCTALMVMFCYASQRLSHRKRWQAAWAGLIAALIGAGFVLLRSHLS